MIFDPRQLADASKSHPERLPHGSGRRALCVGHVLPYPSRAGNEYRIHRLLRWLAHDGWDLMVVVCPAVPPSEPQMLEAASVYPNLIVCTPDGVVRHRVTDKDADVEALLGRRPSNIAALLNERDDDDPARARMLGLQRGFCPDVVVDLVRHLDQRWRPELLLAEYVFMTRSMPLLRRDLLKVVDTIDVFSTKASKVEAFGVSDGFAMTDAEEAALLRRADVLIGIQPQEAADLARLAPDRVVVSVGVDFAAGDTGSDTGPSPVPTTLLVGSDNPMNVKGIGDFLRIAWPLVRSAVPDAELRIVGLVGESIGQPPAGVRLLGCLDRLEPEYARARVAINPAIAGTGLKIKTVEALAHLRPIVSWPAGIDGVGLEGRRFCHVAQDWSDFAGHLIRLLLDTTDVTAMGEHREALAQALSSEAVYAPLRHVLGGAPDTVRDATRAKTRRTVAGEPPRILTLLARHGTDRYPDAEHELRSLFADQLPAVQHDMLVVDNALPIGSHACGSEVELIGGSNSAWEFSAWDGAIAHLGARLDDYDVINLATSAFQQLYVRHLDRIDATMLGSLGGRSAAIGHIDHYNEPVSLLDISSQAWLRSSFVLVTPQELRGLGSLVSITSGTAFFSGDPAAPFRTDAPLSDNYRRNILGWLVGEGTGQGVAWHSRFELTTDTLGTFEHKTLAILNEQMLTNRLHALGCPVVDATWLATHATRNDGRVIGTIPGWRTQISTRDTDPVVGLVAPPR